MKKIAFFQSDQNVGGIQKSIITLLNNLDDSLYEVDLFLFSEADFFEKHLPENVRIIRMKPFPKYTKLLPFSLVRKMYGKTFASNGHHMMWLLISIVIGMSVLWARFPFRRKNVLCGFIMM